MTETAAPGTPRTVAHLQLFDFLDGEEYQSLLDHVASRANSMAASTVIDPNTFAVSRDAAFRRSRVDPEVELVWPPFEDRLRALLPHLRRELGVERFTLGSIERQLTVHTDGDFFSRHLDENHPWTDGCRMITFVYYFNAEPRLFEGGQLRLYDNVQDPGGASHPAESYTEIEPVPNSIVFFPANSNHEVVPVRALGDGPGSIRCTVNGWYRAGDLGRPLTPPVEPAVLNLICSRLVPRVGDHGFAIRPTPEPIHRALESLWELGRDDSRPEAGDPVYFPDGAPEMLPIGPFGNEILERLLPLHEEWAGTPLRAVGAYGMRIYRSGQRATMQVDRPGTHVVSSMLVVAQDVDAPWPFQLELAERRHELHLQPGQMLLYEGAASPHGHLVPLAGRAYVVLFLHYCPVDWPHSEESLIRQALADGIIDVSGRVQPLLRGDPRWTGPAPRLGHLAAPANAPETAPATREMPLVE